MAISAQSVASPENIPPEFPKALRGERATFLTHGLAAPDAHRRATAMASNPPNTARSAPFGDLIRGQVIIRSDRLLIKALRTIDGLPRPPNHGFSALVRRRLFPSAPSRAIFGD